MKIAVTGSSGLLGWHATARLHAQACAAQYRGDDPEIRFVQIDRKTFEDHSALTSALEGVDGILHFAGVNRGEDAEVEEANPRIAKQLTAACQSAGVEPHIVYANSIHAARDTSYGRSKRIAGEYLAEYAPRYTNLILPHIFGECAQPYYNNVVATLIDQIWKGDEPTVNPEGRVQLLHAGTAAQMAIDAVVEGKCGTLSPKGRDISVVDLHDKLRALHALYTTNVVPDVSDPFDLALFNSLRTAAFPDLYPFKLKVTTDERGALFESAKGLTENHTFLSTTRPGQVRGNHFHYDLIERFVVVRGEAIIRVRKVLTNDVHEFRVSGDEPVAIDQIPFHTHNIENIGEEDVITFFWTHRIFDPSAPDTYADPV